MTPHFSFPQYLMFMRNNPSAPMSDTIHRMIDRQRLLEAMHRLRVPMVGPVYLDELRIERDKVKRQLWTMWGGTTAIVPAKHYAL